MGGVSAPAINCRIECKSIGRHCSIAENVYIGSAAHSPSFLSTGTLFKFNAHAEHYFMPFIDSWKRQNSWEQTMKKENFESWHTPLATIGNDVWIGMNVTILNGVNIGDGAIIAAGAVVTKDVEPYSIVGGVPAKKVRKRFPEEICTRLEDSKWWNYEPEVLFGLDLSNPVSCIDELEHRLKSAEPYQPQIITL